MVLLLNSRFLATLGAKPEIGKPLSNVFKNHRSLHVGKFRVIYSYLENTKEVLIANIKHRKHAYEF
ncbi:MAG: hypothetical protein COT15_00390 [Candidatus Diapherotrites archaeon CG08_land_8_20_14_0_20_34_12]|nr:MAG: hypothetical protein COT15_00390 [Candidatus Diapherotrites archaeon CG08_land_8_20_14_0_20_34_12]